MLDFPGQSLRRLQSIGTGPTSLPWCIFFSAIRYVKKLTHLEDFCCRVWQVWVGGSFDGWGLIIPLTLWHFLTLLLSWHTCQWLLSAEVSEGLRPADTIPLFCGLWGYGMALPILGRHGAVRPLNTVRPSTHHVSPRRQMCPSSQTEFSRICSKISGTWQTGKQMEKV